MGFGRPLQPSEDGVQLWHIANEFLTKDKCVALATHLLAGEKSGLDFVKGKTGHDPNWPMIALEVLNDWCRLKGREATGDALLDVLEKIEMGSTAAAEKFRQKLTEADSERVQSQSNPDPKKEARMSLEEVRREEVTIERLKEECAKLAELSKKLMRTVEDMLRPIVAERDQARSEKESVLEEISSLKLEESLSAASGLDNGYSLAADSSFLPEAYHPGGCSRSACTLVRGPTFSTYSLATPPLPSMICPTVPFWPQANGRVL